MNMKMNKLFKSIALIVSLMLPAVFCVAATATTKVFDSITSYKSAKAGSSPGWIASHISGIEKDTGNLITANFNNHKSDYNGLNVQSICTPLVLTAIEKPGRYYLSVSWDPENHNYIDFCMLELKSQPE